MSAAPQRLLVEAGTRPRLSRHAKLRHDTARDRWVILAPERVLSPDETAVAVLRLCDGSRMVRDIAEALGSEYDAPAEVILQDILPMLQELADKGVVIA